MRKIYQIAGLVAGLAALSGCTLGNIDPISEDNSQGHAGIETTLVTTECGEVERKTGREAAGETFSFECAPDGTVSLAWSSEQSKGTESHKARAAVETLSSEKFAEIAPDMADVVERAIDGFLGAGPLQ